MEIKNLEKRVDHSEQLPQIVQRIFAVCKEDPNLPLRNKIREVENDVLVLKKKLVQQGILLRKSKESRGKLLTRITKLDQKNTEITEDLLDELGSK